MWRRFIPTHAPMVKTRNAYLSSDTLLVVVAHPQAVLLTDRVRHQLVVQPVSLQGAFLEPLHNLWTRVIVGRNRSGIAACVLARRDSVPGSLPDRGTIIRYNFYSGINSTL